MKVTSAALTEARVMGSSNSNLVNGLSGLKISDPPTRDEMETMRQKMNELVSALRR